MGRLGKSESYIGLQPGGDVETLKPGDEIAFTTPAVDLIQMVGKYIFGGTGTKPAGEDSNPSSDTPPPNKTPRHDFQSPSSARLPRCRVHRRRHVRRDGPGFRPDRTRGGARLRLDARHAQPTGAQQQPARAHHAGKTPRRVQQGSGRAAPVHQHRIQRDVRSRLRRAPGAGPPRPRRRPTGT